MAKRKSDMTTQHNIPVNVRETDGMTIYSFMPPNGVKHLHLQVSAAGVLVHDPRNDYSSAEHQEAARVLADLLRDVLAKHEELAGGVL